MEDQHDVQLSAPARPSGDPGPAPYRVAHRPWSTILIVVHGFTVAFGVFALALGALVNAGGSETTAPNQGGFEELGQFIAAALMVVGSVATLVSVVVIALTVSGRRRADDGHPRMLLNIGLIVVMLTGIAAAASLVTSVPIALPFLALYVLPAVFLIRATQAPAA